LPPSLEMARARLLVADEDELLLGTVAWLLKERGYDVVAVSGAAALEQQMQQSPPDVLVLEVAMRDFDERLFFERLEDDEKWRDVRVVVISSAQRDSSRLLGIGASDFLTKPVDVRELLARVQVQVRIRQEIRHARRALDSTEAELRRARDEAESRRKLVDILHEVAGDFSAEELSHLLVRRVARALNITHCSLILARPGAARGVVATAYENPGVRNFEVELSRYPAVQHALQSNLPVLVEDLAESEFHESEPAEWETDRRGGVRSLIALPFSVDDSPSGVVYLRTLRHETPLTRDDVEFADTVVRAAVTAMRRAQLIEATRADTARLEHLATTDPLTQLSNRRALMERLGAELDRARRYALTLSVLMIDLDHFKSVNDTFGHGVGDEVLREVAKILEREARSVDIVARMGGEEFVVALPETSREGAIVFAERIRQRVEESQLFTGEQYSWLRVTVSIGSATVPEIPAMTTDEFLAAADAALYRAKHRGRNRVST
jgi:two-component system, cell cycle response regulator